MTEPAPVHRKRRLALSLRGLLVLTLVVGGLLGWITYKARVQQQAVARIQRAGGGVAYEWEWANGKPAPPGSGPIWPKWLVDTLGPDLFGHVVSVNLGNKGDSADDALMPHVAKLDRLESLSLFNTAVTDKGLAHLSGLTHLKALHLHSSKATGAGFVHLKNMVDLEDLMFPTKPVTDADLAHLTSLPKIKELKLWGSQVTDTGLAHLSQMTQLEHLDLQQTKVTDLTPLRDLKGLKWLLLQGCPITDAGAAPIAGFRDLEVLWLGGSRVTDKAIRYLVDLPKLKNLGLNHTVITDAGLEQLGPLPRVESLNVFSTRVTPAGLSALAGQPILRTCKHIAVGPDVSSEQIGTLGSIAPGLMVMNPILPAPSPKP